MPHPTERKLLNMFLFPVWRVLENALRLPTVSVRHLEDMECRVYSALLRTRGWPSMILTDIDLAVQLNILKVLDAAPKQEDDRTNDISALE